MLPPFSHLAHRVPKCPSPLGPGEVTRALFLPSSDSQSCWEDGSVGRARALYSNTTELEMIWLLKATCRVTRPVSWAESRRKSCQGGRRPGPGHTPASCPHPGARRTLSPLPFMDQPCLGLLTPQGQKRGGFRCSICIGLLCAISLFRLFLQARPDSLSLAFCVFSEVLLHSR